MYEVLIKTEFAAAHSLRNYRGACEAVHGHNWKVEVSVITKTVDKAGLAIDFKYLKDRAQDVILKLDHVYLNDLDPFKTVSPSSENIARHIFEGLKSGLPQGIGLRKVTVWETDDAAASYYEE